LDKPVIIVNYSKNYYFAYYNSHKMFNNLTVKTVKDHIGSLVKLLRKRENLTQVQLAEKLNMSRLTIQNLESGKNPTIDTLLKVLQYFDILDGFNRYVDSEVQNNSHKSLY